MAHILPSDVHALFKQISDLEIASRAVDGLPTRTELEPLDVSTQPGYLLIHQANCRKSKVDGEDHSDHSSDDFLDVPRLFAGDTRASRLRGRQFPPDEEDDEDFWKNRPVIIYREYDCHEYHRTMRSEFKPLSTEQRFPSRVRPWVYHLTADGEPAVARHERIEISDALNSAITLYSNSLRPLPRPWNPSHDLEWPYDYFFHFRRQLREASLPASRSIGFGPTEKLELGILLDYIDQVQGSAFDEISRELASGRVHRRTFGKLFAPNDIVISMRDEYPRAYIAQSVSHAGNRVTLECWTWNFDGSFRKAQETIKVELPGAGPEGVSIRSLTTWPLKYDDSDLKDSLTKRGQTFWSCRNRRLVNYKPPAPSIFEMQVTNPKYMIDYKTYRQMFPGKFSEAMLSDHEMRALGIDMDSEEPPGDEFCLLFPPIMLGYAFHDKKWRSLSIEHIAPVEWNKEAFSRLVLKPQKKDIIKALVSIHLTDQKQMDVIDNKGNGLIILLHGSPGCGKTLTAETVAEIAEKPLYRVTCADIGTSPDNVEKYLESVLLIGSIWQCVVLLDEADVFLEERQVTDLNRNALVSVFLRVLEYYDGILILTTNRVGSFDEALKSRFQLAVHYPPLDISGRRRIWGNLINMLKERGMEMDHVGLMGEVHTLAAIPLNGRQIRNSLWAAAQVAKYRKESLGYNHLEEVVDISQEFESYLLATRGGRTDEEHALVQELRHPGESKQRKAI